MPSCEKCYAEARTRAMCEEGDILYHYYRVMKEAEESGQPCTPREKAGQWWDEERQCDTRIGDESSPNLNTSAST